MQMAKATELLRSTVPANMGIGPVAVTSAKIDEKKKSLDVTLSETYGDVPFTSATVK